MSTPVSCPVRRKTQPQFAKTPEGAGLARHHPDRGRRGFGPPDLPRMAYRREPRLRYSRRGGRLGALTLANTHTVDLAILDWHLGAGNHGLQLLEDLAIFNPDVVAIMVTGFAHQATPLDAMRMGVRDYLDKNTDLKRETFLAAVRKQLDRLRPAKRQRQVQRGAARVPGCRREGRAAGLHHSGAQRSGTDHRVDPQPVRVPEKDNPGARRRPRRSQL